MYISNKIKKYNISLRVSFCFLEDTLDGDGGADLAATARIRNGWMKFRELLPFLTSKTHPLEMKGRVYASVSKVA